MYTPQVLDHFEHPRNVGELPQPDVSVQVENPACGDIMKLELKVAGDKIIEVRYRTRGCVASIASGSQLTEMIQGRSLETAQALQREELVASLGGLSNETMHASYLAMDALTAALKRLGK